ncbi:integration host factor [bacterium]|nr:integration host factor [bacterium]
MAGPPQLTPEQRSQALEMAAEARRARAEVKELLKSGAMTLVELLESAETDKTLAGMKVKAVLSSLPGLGKVKSARLMEDLGISENRRIRGLGSKQREALLAALS